MRNPMVLSHLTLPDLECQIQGHQDFEVLYIRAEPS